MFPREQRAEGRHLIGIGRECRELRIVQPRIEPAIEPRGPRPLATELRISVTRGIVGFVAGLAAGRLRHFRRRIDRREVGAQIRQDLPHLGLTRQAQPKAIQVGRPAACPEPAFGAFDLHEGGKPFVERGVAGQEDLLVRELVEQHTGQINVAAIEHRAQDGIGEPAQRGIGRHATDEHIIAPPGQLRGELPGLLLAEPAAIGRTTRDRITPVTRLERKLRRGKHVPHHGRAVQVDVTVVAARCRQVQLKPGEQQRIVGHQQFAARRSRRIRICQDLFERHPGTQHGHLAGSGLKVIASAAAGQGRGQHHDPHRGQYPGHYPDPCPGGARPGLAWRA